MQEVPAPWHLHLPGAVRVQRACVCSRINWSTKKLGGNAASCQHTSRLSWAAPSRVHSEGACSTGSFTCLLQYSGWAVQGQVCCCTYSHLVHLVKCHAWWGEEVLRVHLRNCFWSSSSVGRRLSKQIASSTRDVWSWDHYSVVTTTANAERSPGCYCIRLARFPGSDCEEYENVETEFILSFNIISQKESTSNGISRGKSSYKTNGFLLSLSVSRW